MTLWASGGIDFPLLLLIGHIPHKPIRAITLELTMTFGLWNFATARNIFEDYIKAYKKKSINICIMEGYSSVQNLRRTSCNN